MAFILPTQLLSVWEVRGFKKSLDVSGAYECWQQEISSSQKEQFGKEDLGYSRESSDWEGRPWVSLCSTLLIRYLLASHETCFNLTVLRVWVWRKRAHKRPQKRDVRASGMNSADFIFADSWLYNPFPSGRASEETLGKCLGLAFGTFRAEQQP